MTVTHDIACRQTELVVQKVISKIDMADVWIETWDINRFVRNDVDFAINALSRENW